MMNRVEMKNDGTKKQALEPSHITDQYSICLYFQKSESGSLPNNLLATLTLAVCSRSSSCTETASTHVISDIYQLSTALITMLDMCVAFATADHQILLQRLNISFGISSTVSEWFTSFLSEKQQCVQHSATPPPPQRVHAGSLKGQSLAPSYLFFTLRTSPRS